jgi:hypothetical protein
MTTYTLVALGNLGGDFDTVGAQVSGKINISAALKASFDPAGSAAAVVAPDALAAALEAFSPEQKLALLQSLIATLSTYSGSGAAPVSTGQSFINDSGYVVVAK